MTNGGESNCDKDNNRLHQFSSKVLECMFFGFALHAEGTGQETYKWQMQKELKNKTAVGHRKTQVRRCTPSETLKKHFFG